jgi:hypothetical protein
MVTCELVAHATTYRTAETRAASPVLSSRRSSMRFLSRLRLPSPFPVSVERSGFGKAAGSLFPFASDSDDEPEPYQRDNEQQAEPIPEIHGYPELSGTPTWLGTPAAGLPMCYPKNAGRFARPTSKVFFLGILEPAVGLEPTTC